MISYENHGVLYSHDFLWKSEHFLAFSIIHFPESNKVTMVYQVTQMVTKGANFLLK
jgi:hypothetical protein